MLEIKMKSHSIFLLLAALTLFNGCTKPNAPEGWEMGPVYNQIYSTIFRDLGTKYSEANFQLVYIDLPPHLQFDEVFDSVNLPIDTLPFDSPEKFPFIRIDSIFWHNKFVYATVTTVSGSTGGSSWVYVFAIKRSKRIELESKILLWMS